MNDGETKERMFPENCYAPKALDWLRPGDEWKCGGSYALLAAERGSGTLRLGMRRIGMKRGECLLLAGSETLALEAEPAADWRLYALAFDVARVSGYGAEQAALPPQLPLYDLLRLRPPEQVERELRMKQDRFKTIIALHQLPDYAADRLILLVSDEEETQLTLRRVMASHYWAAYPAVQSGRVAICDAAPWYPSDPLSIEAQLRETVALHEAHLH
ncbi:AraC family ligand binding domain-containing protein [Paenibacillus cymbidii]|uniref:AraC family ligand binding domain-containing protein n=1 Tax=Paenibacillus cymbidii TaxID=1639034 RepID=UPI0010801ACE|nr:AraC family ligand binding domain-containing protein [Paenibacillus cymbidii]